MHGWHGYNSHCFRVNVLPDDTNCSAWKGLSMWEVGELRRILGGQATVLVISLIFHHQVKAGLRFLCVLWIKMVQPLQL